MRIFAETVKDWFSSLTDETQSSGDELFPGVVKPTTTLAKMIASKLLTEDFNPSDTSFKFKDVTVLWEHKTEKLFTCPSGKKILWVDAVDACNNLSLADGKPIGYWSPSEAFTFNSPRKAVEAVQVYRGPVTKQQIIVQTPANIEFTLKELDIIKTALDKGLQLAAEREKTKKAAQNQDAAVSLIAEIMGVEKPSPPSSQSEVDEFLSPVKE